jgi:hypothetical protein
MAGVEAVKKEHASKEIAPPKRGYESENPTHGGGNQGRVDPAEPSTRERAIRSSYSTAQLARGRRRPSNRKAGSPSRDCAVSWIWMLIHRLKASVRRHCRRTRDTEDAS